jgi:hypothetical protein
VVDSARAARKVGAVADGILVAIDTTGRRHRGVPAAEGRFDT